MGKSEYLEKVGARIKARRREMGLTQMQLADLIGYQSKSRNTTINKIETGHSDIPISRLMKFSEVLGLSVKYLLTGEEDHNGQRYKD